MHCKIHFLAMLATTCLIGVVQAGFPVTWDGGDEMWYNTDPFATDGNWNGGKNVMDADVLGRENGHEGYRDTNGGVDILINNGNVSYDGFLIDEDFWLMQGDKMTITGGASWEQETLDSWFGTIYTLLDMSELNLDNGTSRRTGENFDKPEDVGGGAMLFMSWKGDDNFDGADRDDDNDVDGADFLDWQRTGADPSHLRKIQGMFGQKPVSEVTNVNITNGGSLENVGTMMFGKTKSFDASVTVTINDGSIVASGGLAAVNIGDIGIVEDEADIFNAEASLIFVQHFGYEDAFKQTTVVNFTGPGSITTDEGAVRIANVVDDIDGNEIPTVIDSTYEDLWDEGILQANGGSTGVFSDHFSVTGNWGDATYTLTSLIPAASATIGAVPEPTSVMLAGLAALVLAGTANRRRRA